MLPRHVWCGAWDSKAIDNVRSKINKQVRKITKWHGEGGGGQCLISQVFGIAFHTSFVEWDTPIQEEV